MLEGITLMALVVAGIFALPVLFMYVIPWIRRRWFKKYFQMSVVPQTDSERRIAKPYLTARLAQYRKASCAANEELGTHIGLDATESREEVEIRIKKLREIKARVTFAESEEQKAQSIYDKLYPPNTQIDLAHSGTVRP